MPTAVGLAVHLSFDLFPKGWSGFALISVPSYGWTAPWFSGAWIAFSTVFCAYLAIRLVKNWFDGCLLTYVVGMRVWLHQHWRGCVLEARCRADSRYSRRTDTGDPPRQILYPVGCPPCRLIVSLNSFGYTAPGAGLCEVLVALQLRVPWGFRYS